jgi:hypothetical protein
LTPQKCPLVIPFDLFLSLFLSELRLSLEGCDILQKKIGNFCPKQN